MSLTLPQELNYSAEQIQLIKSQICKGATDDELRLFLYTAKRAGVDPLLKQIYAVRRGGQMVIQMGIDGFRAVAAKQGDYYPGDESFEYDDAGNLVCAKVTIHKLLPNGQLHAFCKPAYWVEFAQYQYNKTTGAKELAQFWKQFPRVMLAKCAEASALRKGWPNVFGKIYAPEELNAAIEGKDEAPAVVISIEDQNKEPKTVFMIPENVNKDKVAQYLEEVASTMNKPVSFFKERAMNNPDRFWEQFNHWEHSQPRQEKEEMVYA